MQQRLLGRERLRGAYARRAADRSRRLAAASASSVRQPKDPARWRDIEHLRRELEDAKANGSPPGAITRAVNWLASAANTREGFGLAAAAYRWVLDVGPFQLRPRRAPDDADADAALEAVAAAADPSALASLIAVTQLSRRAALKLARRHPAALGLPPAELFDRMVALKALLPAGTDVGRVVELLPSAFLAADRGAVEAQVAAAAGALAAGLEGADLAAMFTEDPTLVFEDVESLEVGLRRMRELWRSMDAAALAASDPADLALAVRALGLRGPPRGA